jgi:NADH-quinone oxidoreductase subunit H
MDLHQLLITVVTIIAVVAVMLGTCAYLILLERKVAAYMQDRIGPNRVGPAGLLQPIADGLKFLLKEDIIPDHVDKILFLLAPGVAVTTALLAFAVVPFGPTPVGENDPTHDFVIAPKIDIGMLFIFAVTSLTVYAIILSGWASNSKYSFIGGLRSSAQLVSYEIPMGMSVLGVVLLSGSLNLEQIIAAQTEHIWNIWYQPLGFLIFMISAFAECNRLPFDLPEAEQELVGGYHTEYSALKFGMFFLGEYTHMITTSFLMVILFFGGWHFPWIDIAGPGGLAFKFVVFFLKVTAFILFYMLIRWTLPRFRFDQLMGLAWKVLIPLALANVVCVMVIKELNTGLDWLLLPLASIGLLAIATAQAVRRPGLHRPGERLTRNEEALAGARR